MAQRNYGDQNGRNKPASSTPSERRVRLTSTGMSQQPNWGRIDGELIRVVLQYVTVDDGAIRFGYSRDGGAYSVGIYGDGDPYTVYYHSDEEVTEFLGRLAKEYIDA